MNKNTQTNQFIKKAVNLLKKRQNTYGDTWFPTKLTNKNQFWKNRPTTIVKYTNIIDECNMFDDALVVTKKNKENKK